MRLDDRIGLGLVARNFGIIYHYKKNYMQSEEYFNKSIKLLKQLKVPFELGTTFMEYGLMLTKLGDKSEARKCLEYSLKIFKDMDAKIYVKKLQKLLTSKQFKSKHYKMKKKKKK
jgi:tetratricopeptide (TPR) repeat protein